VASGKDLKYADPQPVSYAQMRENNRTCVAVSSRALSRSLFCLMAVGASTCSRANMSNCHLTSHSAIEQHAIPV
jgi:hypothetical protein